jgi:hypothetical protein
VNRQKNTFQDESSIFPGFFAGRLRRVVPMIKDMNAALIRRELSKSHEGKNA